MALVRAKIPATNLTGNVPLANLGSLKSANIKTSYIQSKKSSINCTVSQSAGGGNVYDVDSGCSVNMGTPNSVNSVFFIEASGQYHLDTYEVGDTGNYTGMGIDRRINGGSWVNIYRQGAWAHGQSGNVDMNSRAFIHWRDRPATTGTVEYRVSLNFHRNGAYWGRIPDNNNGGNMHLIVMEYDTGETS